MSRLKNIITKILPKRKVKTGFDYNSWYPEILADEWTKDKIWNDIING